MSTSLRAQLTKGFFWVTTPIVCIVLAACFYIAAWSWTTLVILAICATLLLVIGGFFFFQYATKLTSPLLQLADQTRRLDKGMPPSSERIETGNEIGQLAQTIYEMAADLELQNRSVKYLAFHDALTGLSNRVNFQMQLEDRIVEAANHRSQCALLYLDIDNFKEINDTRGHEYGDRALRTVANRVSAILDEFSVKEKQKPPLLARIGGDEFAILLSGRLQKAQIAETSESLLQTIAQPLEIEGDLFQLSGSIGIAFYPMDALSASSLFNSADMAMCSSKAAGKGTYRFFTESMSESREQLAQIKTEFKTALKTPGELTLVFQPVVDLNSGRVVGAEALVRWNHPVKGPLYPEQFISVVEHNDIALSADLWVLERVAEFLAKIDLSTRPELRISANISAANLGREEFSKAVSGCIAKSPEMSRFLQLEVNETYLNRDEERAKQSLSELRDIGIAIWLDDFCTGYSSLHHLCVFPVDGIKIDRKFVTGLGENENNRLLVTALINMSESFGIELIANGLDSADDLYLLQKLGCLYAQGFLFSKPIPEEELIQIVNEDRLLM